MEPFDTSPDISIHAVVTVYEKAQPKSWENPAKVIFSDVNVIVFY
jgi:hypothetical protein